MAAAEQEHFKSKMGAVLAVAGSAVGLGNFLRFPGNAVEHGGGAFMIPYFCALIFLGIPLGWVEWTLGRLGGRHGVHGAPAVLTLAASKRGWRYFGVIALAVPLVIYMYYGVIESWCLRYAWNYLTGAVSLGTNPAHYAAAAKATFAHTAETHANGIIAKDEAAVFVFVLVLVANLAILSRGISAGVERFCSIAMPLMAVLSVIVLVRVLTLGAPNPLHPERTVINGLGFMWNPDLHALGDFGTWLAAAGQIFFSLSVGFGVILNYASYLNARDDVVLSSLTAAATNEMFEVVFGGLITVTAAFVFLGASGATGSTFSLGFETLPVVFASMGTIGPVIGFTWFLLLFLAAITSSLSMLQPVFAFLSEAFGLKRSTAVWALSAMVIPGSAWVLGLSKGLVALDTMDFWVGTVMVFVLASIEVVVFTFVIGVDTGIDEAHLGSSIRIPRPFRFILKYVAPTYLAVVFIGFCIQKLPDRVTHLAHTPVARWTLGFVAVVLAALFALVHFDRRARSVPLEHDAGRAEPVEVDA